MWLSFTCTATLDMLLSSQLLTECSEEPFREKLVETGTLCDVVKIGIQPDGARKEVVTEVFVQCPDRQVGTHWKATPLWNSGCEIDS